MSNIRSNNPFSYRDLIYKALIFVCTVTVIAYFLPRDNSFNYQFDINKPWKYGQLIATFDFPIYKDESVVKHEQDSILSTFQPFYQLDTNTVKVAVSKLRNDYQDHLKKILPSASYLYYLEKMLYRVYQTGIISTEEAGRLKQDSTRSIVIVESKLANPKDVSLLFSTKEAYTFILGADTIHFSPEILRHCSLNEYLIPNLIFDKHRTETAKKEVFDNYSWANGMVLRDRKSVV